MNAPGLLEKPLAPKQFSLWKLFVVMLAISVLLGLVANAPTPRIIEARFENLPDDDEALREWFTQALGERPLQIERNGWDIRITFLQPYSAGNFPRPPWNELGYVRPQYYRTEKPGSLRQMLLAATVLIGTVYALWWSLQLFWRSISQLPPRDNADEIPLVRRRNLRNPHGQRDSKSKAESA